MLDRLSAALLLTSASILAFAPACGGADAGAGGGGSLPDPAADACEHLEGGPFADVTATADAMGAPDVSAGHTAHRITLPGDEMHGHAGYVSYAVAEAGELVFFTDRDVDLTLEDAGGNGIPWEDECTSGCTDACSLVENARTVDISSVGTYAVRIESSSESVTLVVVHAGDHDHE